MGNDRPSDRPAARKVLRELRIDRRNLPHWQLGGSTYFITYRCSPDCTLGEQARDVVLDHWRHWDGIRYLLHALVVMPNHVHVLATPLQRDNDSWNTLSGILQTNKGYTARMINQLQHRDGPLWQDERYDRIVRDEDELWEKWNYIAENPVRARLVHEALDYRWSYFNPRAMDLLGIDLRRRP